MPIGLAGQAGGMVGGAVVVAGGTFWTEHRTVKNWSDRCFISNGNGWQEGPKLPIGLTEMMYADDGAALYLAGGRVSANGFNDKLYRLSDSGPTGRWEAISTLPVPFSSGKGAILDGWFYAAAGLINEVPNARMWKLNLRDAGAKWSECSPLPGVGRAYPAFTACANRLYLLGGLQFGDDDTFDVYRDAYEYDPSADRWKRLRDLPAAGYCWSAVPVSEDQLLIAGRADGGIFKDIWLLKLSDMSVRHAGETVIQTMYAPMVKVKEKTWWLMGGEPDANKSRSPDVSVITLG